MYNNFIITSIKWIEKLSLRSTENNLCLFKNGVFSSLPFLSMLVGIGVASIVPDWMRSHTNFRITTIRKIFQLTGKTKPLNGTFKPFQQQNRSVIKLNIKRTGREEKYATQTHTHKTSIIQLKIALFMT